MNQISLTPILPWNSLTILGGLVLLLPLLSFIVTAFIPNHLRRQASWLSTLLLLLATILSAIICLNVFQNGGAHSRFTWFKISDALTIHVGIQLDAIAAGMLLVVCLVSFLVHIYSTKYMEEDEGYKRYYSFLGLFTFSMLGIVLSDSLLLIFIFWELVGLSSYLLIGHWYTKSSASKAAQKAFIVNRIGDAGFIVGLAILWSQFKTLDIEALKILMSQSSIENGMWVSITGSMSSEWLTISGICLFLGAVGKSAQFPLQIWLPDAMEGPTPVSALIHAATMVAAGVFLVSRVFVLLDIDSLTVIAFTGAITAFMGAIAALTQHDIKKVLAYSTISQLGYMLMGMGVGAYDASLFHLFTHAFFKACLFLAAGSVIHALHEYAHQTHQDFDHQDMRNMGGLRKALPYTFVAYLSATLALVGVPLFSGFLSKDAILSGAYAWAELMAKGNPIYFLIPVLGFISVILTALYMTRQVMLVFFGKLRIAQSNSEIESLPKESTWQMKTPLLILALLSLGFVWSFNPFSFTDSWFLEVIRTPEIISPGFSKSWQADLIRISNHHHVLVSGLSVLMIIIGVGVAWFKFNPKSTYHQTYFERQDNRSLIHRLSFENWLLNDLYQLIIVKPIMHISALLLRFEQLVIDRIVNWLGVGYVIMANVFGWIDRGIVDGFVNFSVFFAGRIGVLTKSVQGGSVQSYIAIAIVSLLIIILSLI